jgi:hypothetical protein
VRNSYLVLWDFGFAQSFKIGLLCAKALGVTKGMSNLKEEPRSDILVAKCQGCEDLHH